MTRTMETTPGWERAAAVADHVVTLPGGVPMFFRRVAAGEFRMGSRRFFGDEEPVHRVRITRPYFLGVFPVTQQQFAVWTRAERIEHENGFPGSELRPAENLDWHQAGAFCSWLTQDALPAGWQASLPSEAQWEYACRAGSETEYAIGDGEAALREIGWFAGNSGAETRPVGLLRSNAWGFHDMHGNVFEWCLDTWDAEAYAKRPDGVENPVGEAPEKKGSPSLRVIRGGSWLYSARYCRSAFRIRREPGYRIGDRGFRVLLLPGPVVQSRPEQAKVRADDGRRGGKPSRKSSASTGARAAEDLDELRLPKPEP